MHALCRISGVWDPIKELLFCIAKHNGETPILEGFCNAGRPGWNWPWNKMRVTTAVKPELSLHMMSRLLLCFARHVRDCFHFTAIVKAQLCRVRPSQNDWQWLLACQRLCCVMTHRGCGPLEEGGCTRVSRGQQNRNGLQVVKHSTGTLSLELKTRDCNSKMMPLSRKQKSSPQNEWDLFLLWARDFLAASQGGANSQAFLLPVLVSFSSPFPLPLQKEPCKQLQKPPVN